MQISVNKYWSPIVIGFLMVAANQKQARAESASTCTPTAIVDGDAEVAEVVRDALLKHGVGITPQEDCPTVKAWVTRSESGIVLRIEDTLGRASERTVVGPDAAAAIIESWTRGDLSLPLIMPPSAGVAQPSPLSDEETPPAEGPPPPVARVDIGAEVSGSFDGSIWFGGKLAGCYILGPTCLGLLTRIAADSGLLGDSERMDTHRTFFSLLVTLGFPIRLNRFTILPALGIGAGWLKTSRYVQVHEIDDDANNEEESLRWELLIETASWELVIEGQLYGALDIGRGFSLLFGAAVDVLPLADTSPFKNDEYLLAGEPRGHVRGNIGLCYGL
ncbi:MAG: hypothetical protein GY854_17475 [Deltaproteobacteria bacterium]|nr:hypothetical protein [Deltaproteobacteria bacterium]